MIHDVFISYSSQNKEAAQAICHVLEQNEIRCWIAPRDIPPGADYGDVIEDAIKVCKIVVVLFSEPAASSVYVKSELNVAFEEQKTIIPVRLDQTPLKGQNRLILNKTHWIDAYPNYKTKFNDLVTAVTQFLGKDVHIEAPSTTIFEKLTKILRDYKKIICAIIAMIVLVICFLLLYPLMVKQLHVYTYDKQGLHVKTKKLAIEQEEILTSILDNMVLVEGGSFIMGNDYKNQTYFTSQDSLSVHPHQVTIDNYYVSKYEVTQSQWKAFSDKDVAWIIEKEDVAADMISWENAVAFVDSLSSLTGLQFSLPTEAQWEYAARGGKKSKAHYFAGWNDITEVAWSSYDDMKTPHEVGGKRPNELGLFDMTGNVSEWCVDLFDLYTELAQTNPQGPKQGIDRVYRGGDFRLDNPFDMKTTTRYHASPFINRKGTGLRVVIIPKN